MLELPWVAYGQIFERRAFCLREPCFLQVTSACGRQCRSGIPFVLKAVVFHHKAWSFEPRSTQNLVSCVAFNTKPRELCGVQHKTS